MKKYNVGIIGYSWVATAHITAINKSPNAQVTAIYSSRPHDDAAESEKWGSPIKTYTDLNAMLSDKSIDAVSITSYSISMPPRLLPLLEQVNISFLRSQWHFPGKTV